MEEGVKFVGKTRTKEERDIIGREVAKAALRFSDNSVLWKNEPKIENKIQKD